MADYPVSHPGKPGLGMMDRLDGELQRVMEEIDQLEHILSGVRTSSSDRSLTEPQEAPSNRLHEFILRAEAANQRLRILKSELHL